MDKSFDVDELADVVSATADEDDDVVVITIKSEELFDVEFRVESRFEDD